MLLAVAIAEQKNRGLDMLMRAVSAAHSPLNPEREREREGERGREGERERERGRERYSLNFPESPRRSWRKRPMCSFGLEPSTDC